MQNIIYAVIICFLFGYLIGGLNPAFLIAKLKGFDIRNRGSGNAGASNAVIVLGKAAGLFCALFDILKAYLAVKISIRLYPMIKIAGAITGVACILGHIFPIFMKFVGGKGLACLGGVLLSYDVKLFVILLSVEIIIALLTTYICSVATSGSIILTVIMIIKDGLMYGLIFVPVIIAIWSKHIINFKRIRYGVEAKVEYLWHKQKEQDRIRNNWNKLTQDEKIYVNLLELN